MNTQKFMWYVVLLLVPFAFMASCDDGGSSSSSSSSPFLTNSDTEITTDGSFRYIRSNGMPNHDTGEFPNANNPHSITAQNYNFRMPLNPQLAGITTQVSIGKFGIALNGIPFDPGAAEYWNNNQNSGWQYEALGGGVNLGVDQNNAHVQPSGAYHYHGMPTALVSGQSSSSHSALIGYAADGFPVYARYGYANPNSSGSVTSLQPSYQLKSGTRSGGPGGSHDGTFTQDYQFVSGSGDLDDCNGRTAITPEYPNGTYAYFLTDAFPHIPRCLKGTRDSTFASGPNAKPHSHPHAYDEHKHGHSH